MKKQKSSKSKAIRSKLSRLLVMVLALYSLNSLRINKTYINKGKYIDPISISEVSEVGEYHQPVFHIKYPELNALIRGISTPEEVVEYFKDNFVRKSIGREGREKSFIEILKEEEVNCVMVSRLAAALLQDDGYAPITLDMYPEKGKGHNIFLFKKEGKFGYIDGQIGVIEAKYETVEDLIKNHWFGKDCNKYYITNLNKEFGSRWIWDEDFNPIKHLNKKDATYID